MDLSGCPWRNIYCAAPKISMRRRTAPTDVPGAAEEGICLPNTPQALLKSALRFSMKAAMPSFWSWSAKLAWKVRRSNSSPSDSEDS